MPGNGVNASCWLDEFAALSQPPELYHRDAVLGQIFWTHQAHPLHQIEHLLGFRHESYLLLIGCTSKTSAFVLLQP